jgi:hypothetical protein
MTFAGAKDSLAEFFENQRQRRAKAGEMYGPKGGRHCCVYCGDWCDQVPENWRWVVGYTGNGREKGYWQHRTCGKRWNRPCPDDDPRNVTRYIGPMDHHSTGNLICPYCGYEHTDSWEIQSGSEDLDNVECGSCEREFKASRYISVTYSTERLAA